MAEQILIEYKKDIASFTLVPSDKGRFELSVDGELVFSKEQEGRFPEYSEIKPKIEACK
ncbi:MAG TPA: SelT/SelW/SelH family protein [Candidatus Latescibacteria bacterium]|nr:SelT/SelW/SelH family protein [Candidatus Handelsmanbacteria bacterium]HIL11023.1 SelT/SelW/SelH family protein [Candidatus Latescibacterota bacterium]